MSTTPDLPASSSPRCPPHQRAAVATCVRCGTFLCGECTELLGESAYCASCATFLQRNGSSSRAIWGVFGLGLAGLLALPFSIILSGFFWFGPWLLLLVPWLNVLAGLFGPWLPLRELRRIARGESSRRGRAPSWWALWLALANLVIALYWLLAEHIFWYGYAA